MNRRKFIILGTIFMATPSFAKEKDVYITKNDIQTFYSVYHKLNKIESLIGYANFNIVSFDETIKIAKNYSKIGKFTKKEIDFIEYIFYTPAKKFGFLGEKTVSKLTNTISKKDIIKIPATGHYLFRGEPYLIYTKMKKDVANIYLTSGIRNVPKQLKLFLRKIDKSNLNISKASFSIAPPAYSYHSISDFDVGKVGWGWKNFTASFAQTTEFSKIRHLNYVGIRYRLYNQYGVRFEPWHIKVI